jgi:dephospho-CoA kinase
VVIDADTLAREVVAAGTPGLAEVVSAFGSDILTAVGELDRPALSRVVFDDPAARAELEAIIHPRVRLRASEIEAAAPEGSVVIHDIPLLAETGQGQRFDAVIVVDVPVELQLERLTTQRGMSQEEAMSRIAAQASREQRRAVADHVIVNDGSLADLVERVDQVWELLTNR